jgi:hypothetical protein
LIEVHFQANTAGRQASAPVMKGATERAIGAPVEQEGDDEMQMEHGNQDQGGIVLPKPVVSDNLTAGLIGAECSSTWPPTLAVRKKKKR